jgi:hypothetical protein
MLSFFSSFWFIIILNWSYQEKCAILSIFIFG